MFCLQGGVYIFQLFDWYSATFSLMFLALLESIVIAWVYGGNRLYADLEMMIGHKPGPWWILCWKVISPGCLVVSARASVLAVSW